MVKINSRLDTVKEKICEFKTHSNRKYLKRNMGRKEKKNSMKELWDSFKQPNERVTGVPKEQEIVRGGIISERIMAKSFMKIINLQILEIERIPSTRKKKGTPPRHKLIQIGENQ